MIKGKNILLFKIRYQNVMIENNKSIRAMKPFFLYSFKCLKEFNFLSDIVQVNYRLLF